MAEPKTVADLFAGHFSSVSRRDPTVPGAVDVDFVFLGWETYNVPFSPGELMTALS